MMRRWDWFKNHLCRQTRTPYDESKYLKTLERRGSPLLKQLGKTI